MANKQNFTPEQWTTVLESTMVVGIAVSAADPSGLWGTLKEAFASSSALAASKGDAASDELVKAVIADSETSEGRSSIQEALRERFAEGRAALTASNARSPACGRSRRSSMPRRPTTQVPSKPGCAASVRKSRRPRWRVPSSALAA